MKNESIERLEYLCNKIPALLNEIDEPDFSHKPLVDKWSKIEILGHLIDSATNNHHRFVRCQFEDYIIIPYQQNEWVSYSHYQQFPTKEIIAFWLAYNVHLVNLLSHISQEGLNRNCKMPDGTSVTIAFLIEDYVAHLEHHLHQIVFYEA